MRKALQARVAGYLSAVLGVASATLLLRSHVGQINPTTGALALLLVVLFVAALWGSRPALVASALGVLCFNFFFLQPVHTFAIDDPDDWVALAEKAGKHVDLLVVPSSDVFQAIAHTAAQLDSAEIVAGRSSVLTPEEQSRLLGEAWEALPNRPERRVLFRVIDPAGAEQDFYLGAHAPDRKP